MLLVQMLYSTDLSDGAGEGNRQGRLVFVVMDNYVLRHRPSPITGISHAKTITVIGKGQCHN